MIVYFAGVSHAYELTLFHLFSILHPLRRVSTACGEQTTERTLTAVDIRWSSGHATLAEFLTYTVALTALK